RKSARRHSTLLTLLADLSSSPQLSTLIRCGVTSCRDPRHNAAGSRSFLTDAHVLLDEPNAPGGQVGRPTSLIVNVGWLTSEGASAGVPAACRNLAGPRMPGLSPATGWRPGHARGPRCRHGGAVG